MTNTFEARAEDFRSLQDFGSLLASLRRFFGLAKKIMLQFYDSLRLKEVSFLFLPGERTDTMQKEKAANEWFFSAEHAYANHHQGCAWCDDTHCVRREKQGARHLYSCQRCDFQVSYDADRDRFHMIPGEEMSAGAETMLEQPLANLL